MAIGTAPQIRNKYDPVIQEYKNLPCHRSCRVAEKRETAVPLYGCLAQHFYVSLKFKTNIMDARRFYISSKVPIRLLVLFALLPEGSIMAQDPTVQPSVEIRDDFSDNELKSFVKASKKITTIQMETEQKMVKAIESAGLTVDRFHQILEEQRNPHGGTRTSAEELKSFNSAAQTIIHQNKEIEERMATSIEEEGIDIQTYNQIIVAYQQNPAIQTRVDKFVEAED